MGREGCVKKEEQEGKGGNRSKEKKTHGRGSLEFSELEVDGFVGSLEGGRFSCGVRDI